MNFPIDANRPTTLAFHELGHVLAPGVTLEQLIGLGSGDGYETSSLTAEQLRGIQQRITSEAAALPTGDRLAIALQLVQLSGGQLPPALLAQLTGKRNKTKANLDAIKDGTTPQAIKPQQPTPKTAKSEPYSVKSGDTLGKIAADNGVTLAQLKAANPGLFDAAHKAGELIKPGEKVVMPLKLEAPTRPTSVEVKDGDTLGKIAARYGVSLDDLKAANPSLFDKAHEDGNLIRPGESVQIPARKPKAAKTVETKKVEPKKVEVKKNPMKKTTPTTVDSPTKPVDRDPFLRPTNQQPQKLVERDPFLRPTTTTA